MTLSMIWLWHVSNATTSLMWYQTLTCNYHYSLWFIHLTFGWFFLHNVVNTLEIVLGVHTSLNLTVKQCCVWATFLDACFLSATSSSSVHSSIFVLVFSGNVWALPVRPWDARSLCEPLMDVSKSHNIEKVLLEYHWSWVVMVVQLVLSSKKARLEIIFVFSIYVLPYLSNIFGQAS